MTTTIEKINQNEIKEADFSVTPFDQKLADCLAVALKKNTSVNKINLSLADITDEGFKPVAEVLLTRKTNLLELNIDSTYITAASLPYINALITKKDDKNNPKVKSLMIYQLNGIHENNQVIDELKKLADNNGVKIFFNNPLDREDIRLFANPCDKLKNLSLDEERKEAPMVTKKIY